MDNVAMEEKTLFGSHMQPGACPTTGWRKGSRMDPVEHQNSLQMDICSPFRWYKGVNSPNFPEWKEDHLAGIGSKHSKQSERYIQSFISDPIIINDITKTPLY